MKMNIPITKVVLGEEEKLSIIEPIDKGWIVQGPNVLNFKNYFVNFLAVNTSCYY